MSLNCHIRARRKLPILDRGDAPTPLKEKRNCLTPISSCKVAGSQSRIHGAWQVCDEISHLINKRVWLQVPQPLAHSRFGGLRGNLKEQEGRKLGYMLHCTFAKCRAKRTSRNCSDSDEELAVRWTSQNRHRKEEGGWVFLSLENS